MIDTVSKILTIIVSYNGKPWLHKCLSSLKESDVYTDILVIDNASTDKSVEIAKSFDGVKVIELGENVGFGRANNVGLKIALDKNYPFVFLLNQDAYVAHQTITNLLVASANVGNEYIISPYHLNYTGEALEYYFDRYVVNEFTKEMVADKSIGVTKIFYESVFVHAAAWLLSHKIISTIGGFDPLFFYTGEDNDYVQRLKSKGFKIGVCPNSLVYHKGSNTGLNLPELNPVCFRNTQILKFKDPAATTKGAIALLSKNFFLALKKTYQLPKHQIEKMQYEVLKKLFYDIPKLLKSRQEQDKLEAYL